MNMLTRISAGAASALPESARTLSTRRRILLAVLAGAFLALLALAVWAYSGDRAEAAPALPLVTVATPLQREIQEWSDNIGRFEPSRSVEVRPRVSGAIVGIHFTDGASVQRGQLLFTIDPRPYRAALAEAQGRLASARSQLGLARTNLDRAERLLPEEAISESDVDRLRAEVRVAEAAAATAGAQVRARALDVEFTQVRAPISGRVSDRRIDIGNLVGAGDGPGGTLLTTINTLNPIYFVFEGSEGDFLRNRRSEAGDNGPVQVDIRLQDETDYSWHGTLDFTDNGLDSRSGTIRRRAVLDNPDEFLTPGMFGHMRLTAGDPSPALLIPDSAIQSDQERKLVLTVAEDGTVTAKTVELGPIVDGLRVVRSGLEPTDRVIIAGVQVAAPGASVRVERGRIAPMRGEPVAVARMPVAGQASFAN
ncbi:efflux RND transporter periplasmic adaptor subunit [Parasphingopyxis marina]|uniref:Efflux RND transporter periplasmic adaptor subunit n=1 Tax=Parasphingopyxis marina TaxID=2761622 RepID=A0A842I3D1_9SPHN|nr:efflux RND transporter periplasmic adaptor subunit [Parasphingopyxis marina]MBC2778890.1 efflux RND transporter periplasmic adaptor subunit [Parasphingopyxis marina]